MPVEKAKEKIKDKSLRLLSDEKKRFLSEIKLFRSVTENLILLSKSIVKEKAQALFQHSRFLIKTENENLLLKNLEIKKGVKTIVRSRNLIINHSKDVLGQGSMKLLKDRNIQLISVEKNVSNMSPDNVLKRGYSMSLLNGKGIKHIEEVKSNDIIETIIFEGNITSTVNLIKKT